jgi:hypothetical protein
MDKGTTHVALEAVRTEGRVGPIGPRLQLEYPLAGPADETTLLTGYIDLVGAVDDRLDVIDFKTDTAVENAYPEYGCPGPGLRPPSPACGPDEGTPPPLRTVVLRDGVIRRIGL